MKTQSIQSQQELKALKKQINDSFDTLLKMRARLDQYANELKCESILQGYRLRQIRQLIPPDAFSKWLKSNCQQITSREAKKLIATKA